MKPYGTSYAAYHRAVIAVRGQPAVCRRCGTTEGAATGKGTNFHWANLTGNYADPWDYWRLCRSCHMLVDNVPAQRTATRRQQWQPPPHGSAHRYRKYKCRCGECRAAATEAHRLWRQTKTH